MRNLEYYMNLDYTLKVSPDTDYDGTKYFIASYEELDGLVGTGESIEEAIDDLLDVKESWFELNIELGRVIPIPIEKNDVENTSIKTTLRLPRSLDKDLSIYAENEGISKNTAITLFVQRGLYENSNETVENKFAGLINNFVNALGISFVAGYSRDFNKDFIESPLNKLDSSGIEYKSPRNKEFIFTN